MKRIVLLCFSIALVLQMQAAESYLISYKLVKTHTKETLKALWKKNKLPRVIVPVHYEVDIYEVIYNAKFVDGTMRKASGIYYVPKSPKEPLPYFMFGHGTEIHKGREISDGDAQQGICLGAATNGYNAIYPDYFGIGSGDGNHIYQHAESEANAFIYMLYAIDEMNKKINVTTNGQLFLTGYSQGGHASFAAHKYLEQLNDPRFQVTASSPMSGAYDMNGDQAKFMFQEYPRPFYLPYLLVSYQEAYHVVNTDNIYSIFKAPYDSILPYYFEGERLHGLWDLNRILPKIPKEAVKDSFIDMFLTDPNFTFKQRLQENNLYDWTPKAPVQLCYCQGDREVSYKNSEKVYEEMTARGIKHVKLNNLSPKLDHNTCALFAVMATVSFFDRFRKHGENPKMKDVPGFKKFLLGIVKKQEEKKYLETKSDKAYY